MKKTFVFCCGVLIPLLGLAQGTVNFLNNSTTLTRTNAAGIGLTTGNTAPSFPAPGGFYYALLTAPSTVTSVSPSAQELLTSVWTFTGLYGTNTAATTGGRFSGGGNVATLTGWQPGVTNSFVIVGWSADLGHDWSVISAQLQGAGFSDGEWFGNFVKTGGYLGVSRVGFGAAGGGASGLPAFSLFGSTPTAQGTPIMQGFDLYPIFVPEPSVAILTGLAAVLVYRFGFAHKRVVAKRSDRSLGGR